MTKIFVVEDSPSDAALIKGLLRNQGHACVVSQGENGVVEEVRSQMPDLVLLDVILPKDNGFSICRQLKADPL